MFARANTRAITTSMSENESLDQKMEAAASALADAIKAAAANVRELPDLVVVATAYKALSEGLEAWSPDPEDAPGGDA